MQLVADINRALKQLHVQPPRALGKLDDGAVLLEVPAFRFLAGAAADAHDDHRGAADAAARAAKREQTKVPFDARIGRTLIPDPKPHPNPRRPPVPSSFTLCPS